MEKNVFRIMILCASAAFLAGCGGGASPAATVSVSSFPLLAGYKALIAAGSTNNFTVSGTCSGTATFTNGAATAATFEGVAGFSVTATEIMNLTNCTPVSTAVTSTAYYDSNYTVLGTSTPGIEYTKFAVAPPPFPATVMVGDTAVYATLTVYTDSTKTTITGQRLISYVVEADTSSTALVNLITKSYDTSNNLLYTQQTLYRIDRNGTLTLIVIDIQYSTTSTNHIVLKV